MGDVRERRMKEEGGGMEASLGLCVFIMKAYASLRAHIPHQTGLMKAYAPPLTHIPTHSHTHQPSLPPLKPPPLIKQA